MMRFALRALVAGLVFAPTATWAQGAMVDLSPRSVTNTPLVVPYYDPIQVDFVIDNAGSAFTGNVDFDVFLVFLGAPPQFMGSGSAFVSGPSVNVSLSRPLPPAPAGSGFQIAVTIDPAGAIAETNENNNTAAAAPGFSIAGADLIALQLTAPTMATRGVTIAVTTEIENGTVIEARNFLYQLYLRDASGGMQRLFTSSSITLLGNSTQSFTDTVTIPTGATLGSSMIVVFIDTTSVVVETAETNNVRSTPITIVDPAPDLTIEIGDVPTMVETGQQVDVRRVVSNLGDVIAQAVSSFYLSVDPNITTADLPMGGNTTVTLAPGGSDLDRALVTIPSGISAGSYYFGAIVDPAEAVSELDETNNTSSVPVQVFESDLRILTDRLPSGTLGVMYRAPLVASNVGRMLQWGTTGGLPPGLMVSGNGEILGVPNQAGSFVVTITVSDAQRTVARMFTLEIRDGQTELSITTTSLSTAIRGELYSFNLAAAGGTPPYQWTMLGGLPGGLTIDTNGVIAGRSTVAGVFMPMIRVTDSVGERVTETFELLVIDPADGVRLVLAPLPDGSVGEAYCGSAQIRLEAQGGVAPYTFRIMSGEAPGLMLATDGALCGVPILAGDHSFVVEVSDSSGRIDTARFSVRVLASGLRITTTTLPDALVGAAYEQPLMVEGGAQPLTWSVSQDTPPAGITLDADGVFRGTPTELGTFTFAVTVGDAVGGEHIAPLAIRVVTGGKILETTEDVGCGCTASHRPVRGRIWAALGVLAWCFVRRRR